MRHALAEARSLAYHRAVAARLLTEPALQESIRSKVAARIDAGLGTEYTQRWLELLEGPREALLVAICRDDEPMRAPRQATPFANLLTPKERWALWSRVRTDFEHAST